LRNKICIISKKEETEEEKNQRILEIRENIRDASYCIKDAEIQFYEDCKKQLI
jgi:hypothetical protein